MAGLLLGAALQSGTPARAEAMLGCSCVKPGAAPVSVLQCNSRRPLPGVCSYEPPKKKMARHKAKKKKKM